ncbi:MAG TPA: stage III sporulation AC/AD family protein [Oscillospiraceae bacterium]|nr:stage III sporulation AC/AD family protein [Oscillospiraceae bacterium]HPS75322.1 stage III sporulation AC/AD family protein [Oscillospiraceae bacterium]
METALRAVAVGVTAAVAALLIKKSNPELALLLALTVVACIGTAAVKLAGAVGGAIGEAERLSGLSGAIFSPVLKCVGIGVVAKLGGDLCRDAGQSAVASAVELTGTVGAVVAALPLLSTLMTMVGEML